MIGEYVFYRPYGACPVNARQPTAHAVGYILTALRAYCALRGCNPMHTDNPQVVGWESHGVFNHFSISCALYPESLMKP